MKNILSTALMLLLLGIPAYASAQDSPDDDSFGDSFGDEPEAPMTGDEGLGGPGEDPGADETAAVDDSTTSGAADHSIGLGVTRTLAGFGAAEAEFFVGDKMLYTGMFGINYNSPDGADATTSILIGGGAFYGLAGGEGTDLYLGGRLDIGIATGGVSSNEIDVEVPLRIEHRFSDYASVHMETGLVLSFIGEEGSVLSNLPGDSRGISLGGSLFGSAGITLYVL